MEILEGSPLTGLMVKMIPDTLELTILGMPTPMLKRKGKPLFIRYMMASTLYALDQHFLT